MLGHFAFDIQVRDPNQFPYFVAMKGLAMTTPKIEFPADAHEWDVNLKSIVFRAIVDGRPMECILPREVFMDSFGGALGWKSGDSDSLQAACERAFAAHSSLVHEAARHFIEDVLANDRREVLIRSLSV